MGLFSCFSGQSEIKETIEETNKNHATGESYLKNIECFQK